MHARSAPAQVLPSALTALGHLCTLAWLSGGPLWLALAGLACDVADGHVARRLRAVTLFGSTYDWLVDTTTAAVLAARISPWVLLLFVPAQAALRVRGEHVCGRAALTIVVGALQLLQGGRLW